MSTGSNLRYIFIPAAELERAVSSPGLDRASLPYWTQGWRKLPARLCKTSGIRSQVNLKQLNWSELWEILATGELHWRLHAASFKRTSNTVRLGDSGSRTAKVSGKGNAECLRVPTSATMRREKAQSAAARQCV
jgi:hypothetical protein